MAPSQYRLAAELVAMIHENFQGFHPRLNEPVRHLQSRNQIGEYKKREEGKLYEELKKQRTNVIEIIEVKQSMQKVIDRYQPND